MHTNIYHTINSGLYLWCENTGVLIDGIHTGQQSGMSSMPRELRNALRNGSGLFEHMNAVLFTHSHVDHFSSGILKQLSQAPHGKSILRYCPGLMTGIRDLEEIANGIYAVHIDDFQIYFLDTVHDGKEYRTEPHQSIILRTNKETILVAGDAILATEEAKTLQKYFPEGLDCAFINPYQAISTNCHDFLRLLFTRRVVLYHLPRRQDDSYSYYLLAKNAQRRFPADLPPLEIAEHMSWIDEKKACWPVVYPR